jgi:hypothetical protein
MMTSSSLPTLVVVFPGKDLRYCTYVHRDVRETLTDVASKANRSVTKTKQRFGYRNMNESW